MSTHITHVDTIIIGAGPAGSAAGLTLTDAGRECLILDKQDVAGGLARTIRRSDACFDVGPHRFFTKSDEVLGTWQRTLDHDLISVDRLTRILYRGRFFRYPLAPANALLNLGIFNSIHAFSSYFLRRARLLAAPRDPASFEDWVSDNFGRVLYEAFFKHYTEKVWGIPCHEISPDWASQRIKGLNLIEAAVSALRGNSKSRAKTLTDRFLYPRCGSGMMYEKMIESTVSKGGHYRPGTTVKSIRRKGADWIVTCGTQDGCRQEVFCGNVVSSMPLSELLCMLSPAPPRDAVDAALSLKYRNHYCVNLLVNGEKNPFSDQWIYVHSPDMQAGRIANYANFSHELQQSANLFPLTVEFFSSTGDAVDVLGDSQRIEMAVSELKKIGLLKSNHRIEDAFVVFSEKAYPVLAHGYEKAIPVIKSYLSTLKGLQTIGRTGLFQYNNQDHSIMTGILAARNILGGDYDVWSVNVDAEYHESAPVQDICSAEP
ncbi:MAG: FAD-dependent oxidoreductase [Pseudomonadota bacterium]